MQDRNCIAFGRQRDSKVDIIEIHVTEVSNYCCQLIRNDLTSIEL